MRRLGLLTLGILCGALAVSGQDGEGDEMSRQIERLRKLLEARIEKATPPTEEQVVARIHDVTDLRAQVQDQPQPFDDLWPCYRPAEEQDLPEPRCCGYEIDTLTEMIKMGVEPESWEMEGASIEPKNGRLFVNVIPRVHAKIVRNLAWCRKVIDRRVSVEVVAVPVAEADAALLSSALELTAEEAQRLREHAIGTVTLAGWDSQTLGGRSGRKVAYVADINLEMADGKALPDPFTYEVFAGATAQVQACLAGEDGALLECRLEFSSIVEPVPTQPTPHGNIEVPRKQLTRVMTSFWAPLGRTVVAGGCTVGEEPCAILVTVRRK